MLGVNGKVTNKIVFISIAATLAVGFFVYARGANFNICSYLFLLLTEIIFFRVLSESKSADGRFANKIILVSGCTVTAVFYFVFSLLMTVYSSMIQISLNANLAIQAVALGITLILLLIFKAFAGYIAADDASVLSKMQFNNTLEQKAAEIAVNVKNEKCRKDLQKLCELLCYADKTIADDRDKEIADELSNIKKLVLASADETEIIAAVEKTIQLCEMRKVSYASAKRGSL